MSRRVSILRRASRGIRPEPAAARVEVETLTPREERELARDPSVGALAPAMPLRLIEPLEARDEEGNGTAWGLERVGALASPWDGEGVVVAVLDSGIDAAHEAFAGVELVQRDFTGTGDGDRNGHGTHCAGILFGRDVGGARVGVARGVKKALLGKVLWPDNSSDSDALFRAFDWALCGGAKVLSLSVGLDFPGQVRRLVGQSWPLELATSAALESYRANLRMFDALMATVEARGVFDGGAVVVAAAGNESKRGLGPQWKVGTSLPAAAQGVLSVGALAQGPEGLRVAHFSNARPSLSAPGMDVVSARAGGGLLSFSGTSVAAPHVAGVAALWWQALRSRSRASTARQVAAQLLATARAGVFAEGVEASDRGAGLVTAPA